MPTMPPLNRAIQPVISGGVILPTIPAQVHPRITRRFCATSTARAMDFDKFGIA